MLSNYKLFNFLADNDSKFGPIDTAVEDWNTMFSTYYIMLWKSDIENRIEYIYANQWHIHTKSGLIAIQGFDDDDDDKRAERMSEVWKEKQINEKKKCHSKLMRMVNPFYFLFFLANVRIFQWASVPFLNERTWFVTHTGYAFLKIH